LNMLSRIIRFARARKVFTIMDEDYMRGLLLAMNGFYIPAYEYEELHYTVKGFMNYNEPRMYRKTELIKIEVPFYQIGNIIKILN